MILFARGKYLNLDNCLIYYPSLQSQCSLPGIYIVYDKSDCSTGTFLITEQQHLFAVVEAWLKDAHKQIFGFKEWIDP